MTAGPLPASLWSSNVMPGLSVLRCLQRPIGRPARRVRSPARIRPRTLRRGAAGVDSGAIAALRSGIIYTISVRLDHDLQAGEVPNVDRDAATTEARGDRPVRRRGLRC